jgi:uncharacterized membrane protein
MVGQVTPAGSGPASESPAGGASATRQAPNDQDRLMAALSYIITIILPLFILLSEEDKKRDFQRYHALQSLGLAVVAVVYEIVVGVISCVLTAAVPFLGCFTWILPLLAAIPFLYYAYLAYQGKYEAIPFLSDFMVQQKWLQ